MGSSQKFAADVSRFVKETGIRGDVVYRKIAMDVVNGVISESPVLEGILRGNWNVMLNRVDKSTDPEAKDKTGTKSRARAQAVVSKAILEDEIYISNNLPYVARIEYESWSKKSPEGMVRITLKRIEMELAATTVVKL